MTRTPLSRSKGQRSRSQGRGLTVTASRLQLVNITKVKIIWSLMLTRAIESISAFTVGMTFAVVKTEQNVRKQESSEHLC